MKKCMQNPEFIASMNSALQNADGSFPSASDMSRIMAQVVMPNIISHLHQNVDGPGRDAETIAIYRMTLPMALLKMRIFGLAASAQVSPTYYILIRPVLLSTVLSLSVYASLFFAMIFHKLRAWNLLWLAAINA